MKERNALPSPEPVVSVSTKSEDKVVAEEVQEDEEEVVTISE